MPRARHHLNQDSRIRAVTLLQQGLSQRNVANRLRVSRTAIQNLWNRYQETRSVSRRPGSGRNRVTTAREDRFIVRRALQERFTSGPRVQIDLQQYSNTVVSAQTVRNRLREVGIRSRRKVRKPKLSAGHRAARLRWAREHLHWTNEEWGWVLFTDECKVKFDSDDRRVRVFRRTGERFESSCIQEADLHGGPSVMVWGGISARGKTDLVFLVDGTVTSQLYVDNVVIPHVIPFAERTGPNFILMHDNARPHTARATREALHASRIQVLDWPAISPDFNPIEHVWDYLKREVKSQKDQVNTQQQLMQALTAAWGRIPADRIPTLIDSMPNRLQACVTSRGGHTRY